MNTTRPSRRRAAMLACRQLAIAFAIGAAIPANAQTANETVTMARAAAQADRNAESAELFEQAIDNDPSLRTGALRELADQLTYSDRAGLAVPLYREVLVRSDLTLEERRRALAGLALALAWSDHHAEAVATYDAILTDQPANIQALIGRARVLTWQHRYNDAEQDLRRAVRSDPRKAEARRALAEVQSLAGHQRDALQTLEALAGATDAQTLKLIGRTQLWAGRPRLAQSSLEHALAARPKDSDAKNLLQETRLASRPQTEVSVSYANQSDATSLIHVGAAQSIEVAEGATVGIAYDFTSLDRFDGVSVKAHQPAATARIVLSDNATVDVRAGLAFEDEPTKTDRYVYYNTRLTIVPSDNLRFDFGAERSTPDNIRSMLLDIRIASYGASVDIGSDAAWKASLRGSYADYSDGNNRLWGQAELRRRLAWRPNVFAGVRYTRFHFDRLLDNGYFNPRSLSEVEAVTQVWGRWGSIYYDLRGSAGQENTEPGEARFVYSAEGRLTVPATPRLQFEAYIQSFSSRATAPGGFSRTTVGLSSRLRW